ncbi:MAG TPA: Chromate resistance protein ChrB [Candidatus Dormibacteraeota bacterium]
MMNGRPAAAWLVLAWRLPSGSSTPRVTLWRSLRRLGAILITPGAAILPFREDLQEQLDWLAQEAEEQGGTGWVLPVTELSEVEEHGIREQTNADRRDEYDALRAEASAFLERMAAQVGTEPDGAARLRTDRELVAFQRRFRKVRDRDYFGAPGRHETAEVIDRCLVHRQGISARLTPVTDGVS